MCMLFLLALKYAPGQAPKNQKNVPGNRENIAALYSRSTAEGAAITKLRQENIKKQAVKDRKT